MAKNFKNNIKSVKERKHGVIKTNDELKSLQIGDIIAYNNNSYQVIEVLKNSVVCQYVCDTIPDPRKFTFTFKELLHNAKLT